MKETGKMDKDEVFSVLCFLALLCFIYLNINMRKTEIVEFADQRSKDFFVILNPPEDYNNLRSFVLEHFLSFAPKDTTEKYYGYHEYYKETWFTHRSYIEKRKQNDAFREVRRRIRSGVGIR